MVPWQAFQEDCCSQLRDISAVAFLRTEAGLAAGLAKSQQSHGSVCAFFKKNPILLQEKLCSAICIDACRFSSFE